MTLQDLGSLGELIAAIATVATLIYLAIQIRANTVVSKAEARRTTRLISSRVNLAIVKDSDIARILGAGLGDVSKLDPEEWVRFSFLMGEVIGYCAATYDDVRAGILSEEDFESQNLIVTQFLATPGGHKFWEQFGPTFPKGFREFVQREVLPDPQSRWPNPPPRSAA